MDGLVEEALVAGGREVLPLLPQHGHQAVHARPLPLPDERRQQLRPGPPTPSPPHPTPRPPPTWRVRAHKHPARSHSWNGRYAQCAAAPVPLLQALRCTVSPGPGSSTGRREAHMPVGAALGIHPRRVGRVPHQQGPPRAPSSRIRICDRRKSSCISASTTAVMAGVTAAAHTPGAWLRAECTAIMPPVRGSPSPLGQNSPHLCQARCASHVLHSSPFTFSILLIAGRSSQPTSSHRGDRVPVCFKIGWEGGGGGASGTRRQGAIGCTVPGMLLDDIAPQEAIGAYAESTHVGQQRVLQGPPAPNTPRLPAATEACHRSCIAHFRHGDRSMEEQTERHRHLRPDDLHTPTAQTSTRPAVH